MRKNKTGEKKNGYTLMILDDDQNILDALGANFRSMGYEVETPVSYTHLDVYKRQGEAVGT